jgi:hypothetical protein
MFVFSSTHERLRAKYESLLARHGHLLGKWERLVTQINAKGGQDFLDKAKLNGELPFSSDEIKLLVKFCHPDKHANDPKAAEITRKLLKLR